LEFVVTTPSTESSEVPELDPADLTDMADPDLSPSDRRRWLALAVIALAQLMVVLDASIVNIALPSAQRDLGISDANRQWVVTAYTLTFGGLLLLGGRIADYWGRKRAFVAGLLGFAAASALGGLAPSQGWLFAARGLQGAFAALLAPAALSLITVTFTHSKERARAFGVFGAISGGGAAIGLIVGGILTEYTSWRWCLGVNVPIALIAAGLAIPIVHESKAHGNTKYDVPGAITATLGLVTLVYGITKAETDGWASMTTISLFVAAAVLLALFILIESRASNPLLPFRILRDRNRSASYVTMFLTAAGLFAMFLFLTYYMQGILGYSALKTGFAFLPFSIGIIVSAGVASQLLPKFGPRPLAAVGLLMASFGMFWLTRITATSEYQTHLLPSMVVMSLGMGLTFVPISSTALFGVQNHDAGVASALLNTSQQIGGSLGTALLNTIAATATTSYFLAHASEGLAAKPAAAVHGFTVAFAIAGGILFAAAMVVVFAINATRHHLAQHDEVPVATA
jgi:EmrB/QacA subfamily drug resistance transporter